MPWTWSIMENCVNLLISTFTSQRQLDWHSGFSCMLQKVQDVARPTLQGVQRNSFIQLNQLKKREESLSGSMLLLGLHYRRKRKVYKQEVDGWVEGCEKRKGVEESGAILVDTSVRTADRCSSKWTCLRVFPSQSHQWWGGWHDL